MKISTKSYQLILALIVSFFFLLMACKENDVTPQPPSPFKVTAILSPDGKDVILNWTKSSGNSGNGKFVSYSVIYKDTLDRKLLDTTYTIKNLPLETEIKGSVIAVDIAGNKTSSPFSIQTTLKYVYIPDIYFEKALIVNKIDDIEDGKVLRENVINATDIDATSYNITPQIKNLFGIEAFINLEGLNISGNHGITKLDVSKNVKLKRLKCSLLSLTSLDVSKNISLEELNSSGNQLNSLDISKNINLIYLIFTSNKLINLDVSKNVNLITLAFSGNRLTNLDVSKNTKLISLSCSNNELTNFDFSTNINLVGLDCYGNKLTNLDIRKNTSLNGLNCINNKIQTICVNNLNQVKDTWYKDSFTTYKVCP